jgi:SpoIIAA-like
MIELLPDLPDNTIGFVASGHVTAADYESVLMPAVGAALKKHDKVRLLYQVGDRFAGFTPGAMWDDAKLGFAHLESWEKMAIVTDVNWLANAANMFKFVMPCPVEVFPIKERAEALEWLAA